jgi:hypothetical protein
MKIWQYIDNFNKIQICNIKIIAIYNKLYVSMSLMLNTSCINIYKKNLTIFSTLTQCKPCKNLHVWKFYNWVSAVYFCFNSIVNDKFQCHLFVKLFSMCSKFVANCHIFICPFIILCYVQSNLPKFIISLLNNRDVYDFI